RSNRVAFTTLFRSVKPQRVPARNSRRIGSRRSAGRGTERRWTALTCRARCDGSADEHCKKPQPDQTHSGLLTFIVRYRCAGGTETIVSVVMDRMCAVL